MNGVFAVPKDEGKQRLIIDARPANAVLRKPPKVLVPNPGHLAHRYLGFEGDLHFCKTDMDCDTICRPFRAWVQGSWVDVVELDGRTFGGVLGLRDGQTRCWQRKKMTSGTVSKVPFGRQRQVAIVLTAGTVSHFHMCR